MDYKISIIVPCYNILQGTDGEKYLDDAIKSLQNQSIGFENLEIVLVDDGSTDGTKTVLTKRDEKYENVKSVILEENSGTGISRNIGVKNASSDYVMFLDQDDYYTENSCEILYKTIVEKNADMVDTNYIIDIFNKRYEGFEYNEKYLEFSPEKSFDKFQNQWVIWAGIFKKTLLENVYFKTSLYEDAYYYVHAFINSKKIIYLNDFHTYVHYYNKESVSSNLSINRLTEGLITIYNIMLSLEKQNIDSFKVIDCFLSSLLASILMSKLSYSENKQIFNLIREYENKMYLYDEKFQNLLSEGWNKKINSLIKSNRISLLSSVVMPIQRAFSNVFLFEFMYNHVFKHELLDESKTKK